MHTSADTYKIALYNSSATLDATTTVYSATNEATGAGYTAGGLTLTRFTVSQSGNTTQLDFADATWNASTIVASGAMIYNSSKSNKAVAVYSFGGSISSTNGAFTAVIAPGVVGIA